MSESRWRLRSRGLGIAFALVLGACAGEQGAQDASPAWTGQLDIGPEVCSDCLVLEDVATLGDTAQFGDVPGAIERAQFVTRDGAGAYWVGGVDSYMRFAEDGSFLGRIGSQGEGPGEFSDFPGPAFTDVDGNVHVVDLRNARETVFAPSGGLVDEYQMALGPQAIASLGTADRRVVNSLVPGDQIFHIIERSNIETSFGPVMDLDAGPPAALLRLLTTAEDGRIVSAGQYEYVVQVWTGEGELLGTLIGPTINEPLDPSGAVPFENGPLSAIRDLEVADGRLWVVRQQKTEDWRSHAQRVVGPGGVAGIGRGSDFDAMYESVVDVIDMNSWQAVASQTFPGRIEGLLGDHLVWRAQTLESGVPQVAVGRLAFSDSGDAR